MSYPKNTPPKVLKTLKQLEKEEGKKLQLNKINNRFYLYDPTSEWDKKEKKPRKKTSYLGAISLEGVFTPRKLTSGVQESKQEIYEYGNCTLAHHFLTDVEQMLKQFTPHYRELLAAAVVRAIDPQPLRLLKSRWEKLYLSRGFGASLSPKHLSRVLKETGKGVKWWHQLFSSLIQKEELLLYDLTTVFTHSQNIELAEKGYNPDKVYLDQIGIVLAFSKENRIPIGMDVFWGSMKDITTLYGFLNRLPETDLGFILDRGFWSEPLLKQFRKQEISYLAPLRKNSRYLDLRWVRWRDPFLYRNRPIEWGRKQTDLGHLYLFRDPKLQGEQEAALLRRVEQGEMDREEYRSKKKVAGIIGLISDLDQNGEEIYDLWKGRQDVELAFDAMKNTLDADKTYMQSAEAVRGYFFVTFLALRVYFKILKRLREKKLTGKISVKEVLFELSKVQKIVEPGGREYFAKFPKQARKIAGMFPEALPMG